MNISLILTAIRTVALVTPALIGDGKGDSVANVLNTIATLGERGEEAYEDLKALTAKLEAMQGVSPEERAALWDEITNLHNAIQEAAKSIPPS